MRPHRHEVGGALRVEHWRTGSQPSGLGAVEVVDCHAAALDRDQCGDSPTSCARVLQYGQGDRAA